MSACCQSERPHGPHTFDAGHGQTWTCPGIQLAARMTPAIPPPHPRLVAGRPEEK